MKTTLGLCTVVVAMALSGVRARAEDQVSVTDVLAMMDTMPGAPGDPKSTAAYHWSKKPGAVAVARAITATAPDREWAARMAVYTIHESGLSTECVAGDGGESRGAFQLKGVPEAVACDPAKATPIWLARAKKSVEDCAALPASERMAELASGSCGKGHMISRLRESFVLRALAHALPPTSAPSIE
jgi:hypothetical protein